jgi:hypothetical protein
VAQKVNFVIPNRQMFLPSLLLDIQPDRKVGLDLKETIPPFAQCLLLYHLQIESIVGATGYGLIDKFDVSYATANKSLRWLVSKDLIKLHGVKTKTVQIDISNRELWNKALPMLVSPIEQLYYTDAILEGQQISGVNALASYTMLNEESRQCWAVTKKELKTLWLIILIKLFIMFFILKLFFFPNFLNSRPEGESKEEFVGKELINRANP